MAQKPKYRVLVGLNYPPNNKRAEVGDVVTDLPDFAINKLVKNGVVELVSAPKEDDEKEVVIVEHVAANTETGVKETEEKVER